MYTYLDVCEGDLELFEHLFILLSNMGHVHSGALLHNEREKKSEIHKNKSKTV